MITLQVIPKKEFKNKPNSPEEDILSVVGIIVLLIFIGMLINEKGREKLRKAAISIIVLLPIAAVVLFLVKPTLGIIVGTIAFVGIVIINMKKK